MAQYPNRTIDPNTGYTVSGASNQSLNQDKASPKEVYVEPSDEQRIEDQIEYHLNQIMSLREARKLIKEDPSLVERSKKLRGVLY